MCFVKTAEHDILDKKIQRVICRWSHLCTILIYHGSSYFSMNLHTQSYMTLTTFATFNNTNVHMMYVWLNGYSLTDQC